MAVATVRKSKIVFTSGGSPVAARWDGGGNPLFQGYLLLTLTLPTGYTQAHIAGQNIRVPVRVKIPVIEGLASTSEVLLLEDLEPPNCTWSLSWYDLTDQAIAGPFAFVPTEGESNFSPATLTAPS